MPSEWVTYSFKCHVVDDAKLIEILNGIKQGRSGFIRKKLGLGLRLPEPVKTDVLSPELLRQELNKAVETILSNIGTGAVVQLREVEEPRYVDINDNGDRIPDF